MNIGKEMTKFSSLPSQFALKFAIVENMMEEHKSDVFVPHAVYTLRLWVQLQLELRTLARKKRAEKLGEEFSKEVFSLDILIEPENVLEDEDEGEEQEDLNSYLLDTIEAQQVEETPEEHGGEEAEDNE
jgi:hypothetical protein